MGVQIRYETIFGGKSSLLKGVYLYFAKVTPAQIIKSVPGPVRLGERGTLSEASCR